jgi:hypothetical protein
MQKGILVSWLVCLLGKHHNNGSIDIRINPKVKPQIESIQTENRKKSYLV